MFGLIQGVLLSPPPYADPDRLLLLAPSRVDGQPYQQGSTVSHLIAWRQARTFEPPAMYRWSFNFLVRDDGSESLGGMAVTTNYFRTLGVQPLLGRELTDADASRPNVPPSAIVLGYDLWQRKFGGDSQIIGKSIRISRLPAALPIVGVMPPGLRFLPDPAAASEPNYDVNARVDFWLAMTPNESRPKSGAGNAVARLRPGASVAEAQSEASAIAAGLAGSDADLRGLSASVRSMQRGAQSRWAPAPHPAFRFRGARLLHCLRQRRGSPPCPRAPAAAGIRDAFGARGGTVATVSSSDH
jgi:putative ABC transport system permease protein